MANKQMGQTGEVLLEVKGLRMHFPIRRGVLQRTTGYVKAVDNINFAIHEGETLGLVGESGCGKTTTGRCIVRAYAPTGGQVLYRSGDGQVADLAMLPENELKPYHQQIRMIFQDPYSSLNPRMTLLELVGEPLKVNGVAHGKELEERVAMLLRRVGLRPEYLRRYPHAFSGGERQRIGIARALALDPRLVVADEAVSALDVSVRAQILNLLQDLQQELNLTYLFVAHDLSVVEYICDRVAVMYVGKLVELAETEKLYTDPKHPYTEALLSAVPKPDPALRDRTRRIILQGDVADPANPPSGCYFHPRCRYAQERCMKEEPALRDLGGGHWVACHLAEDLRLQGVVGEGMVAGEHIPSGRGAVARRGQISQSSMGEVIVDPRIIVKKLDGLRRAGIVQVWPIESWQARTADYVAPGDYRYDGDWAAIQGESAWPAGKTLFIRAQVQTPPGVQPEDLYVQFDAEGLEGLLSVNGRPYAGIDLNHTRIGVPVTGRLDLEAEFISIPRALCQPELRREKGRLRQVALVQVDHALEAAYYDLWFAWEAGRSARDERRRQLLDAALEDALLAVDLTAPREQLCREVAEARRILGERVAAIAPDAEAGRVFLTGHSHIDTAWLWPLAETVRKVGRTFSTACRMLERFPNYRFSCSQPQLYLYAREHYPALYEQIKQWVKAGRWECTGGMWVEPDCNVPSGESLIRQIVHGVRFFQDEFGVRPRTCWLPDVFGYPASLPQILKGCGVDYFFTNKLHWQARNPFPVHLFWWEGIDGTRLLAHIPKLKRGYNGWPNPEELNLAWENVQQKALYPELLFPFGFGDGGGGPTEDQLEFTQRAGHFPGVPACRQGLEEDYFDDVVAAAPQLPVWAGELYLETHRGTYTTQGAIKRANRKSELMLREAEVFGALANAEGAGIDLNPLGPAWQNLLLLQFHDILPGSSIGQVYREAALDHARIEATGRRVRDTALQALVRGAGRADVVAFNSLSWPRTDVAIATVPEPVGPVEMVQADGRAVPAQIVSRRDGRAEIVFAPDAVPAMGYAAFTMQPSTVAAQHSLVATERRLENRFFLLELAADGSIARLFDKRARRDVVAQGQAANELQLLQDGPEREAAWNVHATFEKRTYAWDPGTTIEVLEQGPVRAAVRVMRRYRESRVEQDIVLYDRVPRIDFVTRADWQERQAMLKAAFPLEVRSARATYEIQFGAVERPTHRNTAWDQEKFEVCAHQWADLSEAGYGVSLLNDCKYGYDGQGNMLRLTLLRGPEWPDPDADRGHHEFTYSLLPHLGNWSEGETVRQAWELNVPMVCVPAAGVRGTGTATRSFFEVEGPAVVSAFKPAEDGDGWVLRLYEPQGSRGPVRVRAPRALRQVIECSLTEDALDKVQPEGDGFTFQMWPFDIKTFRLQLA